MASTLRIAPLPPYPAAFFLGRAHRIVHGNTAFLDAFGASCVGQPAREALVDLPPVAFEVMDAVLRTGRPLARRLSLPGGRFRLVVAPRRDPQTNETYGVASHLRPLERSAEEDVPATAPTRTSDRDRGRGRRAASA